MELQGSEKGEKHMLQKTDIYMKEQKVNLCGERVLIGLSGGMDSVCLFHIFEQIFYLFI